ncbi:type II secretion system F family protein [Yersinia pekkanenii]|uniref:General secretion pathway protein F n=1 Tax=Yersinia pekkanenii TaxID=1288385 RepID=A0A0T9P922_9GAMM|nr:type II secretion system F family protein [Yersinia pekkanenii]CNH52206.1 general protein secretion protein [Yersinia pekkanenii]CRY67828.1 general protein secretion protein [Yersinia pekkanenii]
MSVFKYVAINDHGIKVTGNVNAENIVAARHILYQRKMKILKIKTHKVNNIIKIIRSFKIVNSNDLVLVTRQMSTLVNAAIPLDESLEIIERQNKKSNINRVIHDVRKKITEGYSFSDSLSYFSTIFNSLYRSMIAAGELSGHLGMVLSRLADHIEQTQRLQKKVVQALIYPTVLIFISIGVIVILLSIVIPNIIEQFSFDINALPVSTRILMNISHCMNNNTFLIISIIIIGWVGLTKFLKIKSVKEFLDCHYLKLPMLGKAIFRLNISRYLRTLTILTSNGISLIQAMKISNAVLTNLYIKKQLINSSKLVSEGGDLTSSLALSRVFPPIILHIISSGERSGKLEIMLEKATVIQEDELIIQINIFITLLEPIIMVFMATFILFIVLATFQPILQVNSLIM